MIYVAVVPSSEPAFGPERVETIHRYFAAIQAGDYSALSGVMTPDAVTRWPQSGERITGSTSCMQVYANHPGGPPRQRVERISGGGDVWVAELVAEYEEERWHTVSLIEFDGSRIARMTDYFGHFRAPEWRKQWVEHEEVPDER